MEVKDEVLQREEKNIIKMYSLILLVTHPSFRFALGAKCANVSKQLWSSVDINAEFNFLCDLIHLCWPRRRSADNVPTSQP